ncbi:MAG TPA: TonB-dependent receptor [Bryobacteraceae bacterium]|nr:TonB-dependent receptor [Bryobacteraceae bacterium]
MLAWLSTIPSLAQDRGTISGTVTDASGAAVPGAEVTVTNPQTGLTQRTTTTMEGTFAVPYLPVGLYTVAAEKTGFRRVEATNARVEVTTTTTINLQLQVGQATEIVEVTAAAPVVVSERSDLGTVVNTKTIIDLPLSISGGLRDNLAFTILTPGTVLSAPGDNNSLRIGGGLSAGHSMLLDGAEAGSERRNDAAFQSVSTDAISEFKVISNSYSAEYGRTGNGIINFTTKSGTNELHGSAFEYFRNEALNARGFFSAKRAVVRQNDFGGTAGGPVYLPKVYDGRNKAFFFFSYEKSIFRSGSPSGLSSVPPLAFREGDFSNWRDANGNLIPIYDPQTTRIVGGQVVRDQFPNNIIPRNRINPVAATLNKYLPAPELPSTFNNIRTVGNSGSDQYVWSTKGDYALTSNSRVSGLFSQQAFSSPDAIGPIPGPLGENFNSGGKNKFFRLNHDHVFSPTLLNHLTLGWNKRDVIEYFPQRYYDIPEADRRIIEQTNRGGASLTGLRQPPPAFDIGGGNPRLGFWIDTASPSRTWNVNEQLAWIKGGHSVKFGFTFIRQDYQRLDCNGCTGNLSFNAVTTGLPGSAQQTGSNYASFLLGLPSGANYHFPGDFSFGQPYYSWYVQDDWKVNRKLTLNLGLRYDLVYPKTEKDSRVSNVCLTCPNPAAGGIPGALEFAGEGPGRTGRSRFTDVRKDAWGPRAGFAYQVTPSMVLRAGGGIFYIAMREGGNADRGTLGFGGNAVFTSPDAGVTPVFTLGQPFPDYPKPPNLDPGQALFTNPPFAARYAGHAPRMMNWNFTIEKGIGANTVIRASYLGSAGNSLLANRELLNQVDPRYLALGQLLFVPVGSDAAKAAGIQKPWPTFPDSRSVGQALRPYPQYTGFDHDVDSDTTGHSTYHAGSIQAERRFSAGLWFSAHYTFSKLISNVQGENPGLGGFVGNGDIGTQNAYDRRADKAISNQDVPHHLVLAYSYELPVGRGKKYMNNAHPVVQAALGGWKLSAIHNYQSGYPLRVLSNQSLGIFPGTLRANIISGVPLINPNWTGDPATSTYINPAAFSRPAPFTFGNSPANIPWLRTPALLSDDVTLAKQFPFLSEGRYVEFKASAFNIGNRVQFAGINTTFENANFGRVTEQRNRAREIQLNLRVVF